MDGNGKYKVINLKPLSDLVQASMLSAVLTIIALCLKGMGISAACFADSGTVEIVQRRQKNCILLILNASQPFVLSVLPLCMYFISLFCFVLLGYNLHELLGVKYPYYQTL